MPIPQPPFKAKTKVSWAGEEEGDLGFIENEIIEVHSIVDESWWSGCLRRNKAEGIFPRDYVEVIAEPQTSLSHSASTASLSTPKQGTPKKSSKPGTPSHGGWMPSVSGKVSPMRNSNYYAPDMSYDYDEDVSSDYIEARKSNPKKVRSANKLVSSTNHPKHKHLNFQQHEEMMRERERELENFKSIQQQQHYHLKKSQQDQKRQTMMDYRQEGYTSPEIYGRKNKSKSRPQSQLYSASDPNLNYHKSHSYNDVSNISKTTALFNNQTVESFSPEHSPPKTRKAYDEDLDEYNEIATKRAQLELELQQLKQLERSTQKRRSRIGAPMSGGDPKRDLYDPSNNSSYVSEDILSSKKNYHSRDDLGKKLSKHISDEENDYDFGRPDSPPPPPPPKHSAAMKPYHDEMDHIPRDTSYNQLPRTSRDQKFFGNGKVPFDADDFKFSGSGTAPNGAGKVGPLTDEEIFKLSTLQQEELKNSIKSLQSDVLNLSELSATSAGSFIRHKYERELAKSQNQGLETQQERLGNLNLYSEEETKQLVDSVFQDKKKQNIFKKLLSNNKKENINSMERKLQQDDEIEWGTLKFDVNRMNSLSSHDKQLRTRRIVKEEGNFIIKPLDYISEINTNEVIGDIPSETIINDEIEYYKADFGRNSARIDNFMDNYDYSSDLNELISDISVKFNASKVQQIRCILVHMCKFHIIEETSQISQIKPKLNEILVKGEATIYQLNYLFKKILDALRIPSEIILGFWKKPNEFYHNEHYIINHCWLSVLHDNQFFMIDLFCFENGGVCNIKKHPRGFNEYYFMTKPLNMISTHIPSIIDLQHVIPPVDQNVTFYLPRVYSGFYKSNLSFRNFNNALTRLKDLEFFELELNVPVDVELFSLIKTAKVTTNELSLCQVYWYNNTRIAKVKAILPENENIGVLQIFSGPKGLQKHFDNVHELSIVIPLYHTGTYKPCKFVPRFPTVQSQNNDLYIKHPQTNKIVVKNSYIFEVLQYPSMGLNSGSAIMNQDFKIVIESPSGKYFKLVKDDPSKPYGSYESNIKCQEIGLYRGLVIGDSGNSWYVFAQWECVAGVVAN